jgi:hypothetical protein
MYGQRSWVQWQREGHQQQVLPKRDRIKKLKIQEDMEHHLEHEGSTRAQNDRGSWNWTAFYICGRGPDDASTCSGLVHQSPGPFCLNYTKSVGFAFKGNL